MPDEHDPYQLYADELRASDLAELIDFDCGDDPDKPWSRAATEWLLGSDVWESIEKRGTKVWLFRTELDVIVGFGSLGMTRRKWPPPDGKYSNLLIIPMLGIDRRFHGQPPDPDKRYSKQILSHLLHEARQLFQSNQNAGRETLPLLTLYVHEDNYRAIRLYEKVGFISEPSATRNHLCLMVLRL